MQETARPTTRKRGTWIAAAVVLIAIVGVVVYIASRPEPERDASGAWSPGTRKKIDELHLAAQQYISANQVPKARVILEKLIKDYPDDAFGEVLMAKVLMAEDHAPAAYEHIKRSLELDAAQPEFQFIAGMLAEKIKRPDLARYHYARASDLDHANGRYPMYIAQLMLNQNDVDGAELQLIIANNKDHTLSEVQSMLAEVYARRGKTDMAIDKVNTAISMVQPADPKLLAYTLQKAMLLRRANDPEASLRLLMSLPPNQQQDERTVEQIAQGHLMLSRPARAAAVWAELFALEPNNQRAAAEAGICFAIAKDMDHARQYYDFAHAIGADTDKVKELRSRIGSSGAGSGKSNSK